MSTTTISKLDAMTPSKSTNLVIDNGANTGKATVEDIVETVAGDLSSLTTTAKGSLVGAINELDSDISTLNSNFSTLFPNRSSSSGIGLHNGIFRGKNLGSSISTAQNTAIKNRTYDDLYIGDYWVINGHTWRIAALDYYYNIGDTNFAVGNLIVVPDARLYAHQMAYTASGGYEAGDANTTEGGYSSSYGFKTGLTQARTIAKADFGDHVATHRIICTNATSGGKPSGWAWRDSDGVELMNEQQVYGAPAWRDAVQNGYDVGSQKIQFPLFLLAPQFVNIRQDYWLQDVWSAASFAFVSGNGLANSVSASNAYGIRPAVTLKAT